MDLQVGEPLAADLRVTHGSDDPLALYAELLLIRTVEQRLITEYPTRRLRMALHLSIGQEAVSVGVLGATRPADVVIGTHRSHAIYLAKGAPLQPMIDEFYSLPTGCSGGCGGSMHLSAPEVGLLGSSAVLAGGVPITVGAALAAKRRGAGDVAVAMTGDGAIDEGAFWESLNLAAVLQLPVLFVVENNGYSTLTPQAVRQASMDVLGKSHAFGVEAARVDGNDVVATRVAARHALDTVRATGRPRLIEATTFRWNAHVGVAPDWGVGRPHDGLARWETEDPVTRLIDGSDLDPAASAPVRKAVLLAVDEAFAAAIGAFEAANELAQLAAPPPPSGARV